MARNQTIGILTSGGDVYKRQPQTDAHDYNFKLKHAQEFLSDGNKVRAYEMCIRDRHLSYERSDDSADAHQART